MTGRRGDGETGGRNNEPPSLRLPVSQSPRLPVIIIATIWLISTLLWLTPGITKPDGAGYLVYLPSTYFDHDVAFLNEWGQLGMIREGRVLHKEVTSTGHLASHWTVGTAMYWFPSFVLADGIRAMVPSMQRFPRNGFSLPYNVAVIFATAVAGLLTLLTGYSIARKYADGFAATTAAVGIWFGTPLLYYSLRGSTMSHALSALACGLALAAALRLRQHREIHDWMLAGLAGGFAFVVRPQNAPFALLALFFVRPGPRQFLVWIGSGLLAAIPQFLVAFRIYGDVTGFLWGPFAAFERLWLWEPLLSWYHGLIPWAPITAIGLIGIVLLFRRNSRLAAACSFVFLTQWLINAVVERSFWGAQAFGQRRFDNCTVIFLIGAAVAFTTLPRVVSIFVTALGSLWTMSLFFAAGRIDLNRYYTPSELWDFQIAALRDLPSQLTMLGTVPVSMRLLVLVMIVMCAILWLAGAFFIRRLGLRRSAYLAASYAVLMTIWFGLNRSTQHLPQYRDLIAYNQELARLPGGADVRIALLQDELEYLRKAGRERLAAKTEREIEELMRARRAAEERLR